MLIEFTPKMRNQYLDRTKTEEVRNDQENRTRSGPRRGTSFRTHVSDRDGLY